MGVPVETSSAHSGEEITWGQEKAFKGIASSLRIVPVPTSEWKTSEFKLPQVDFPEKFCLT